MKKQQYEKKISEATDLTQLNQVKNEVTDDRELFQDDYHQLLSKIFLKQREIRNIPEEGMSC